MQVDTNDTLLSNVNDASAILPPNPRSNDYGIDTGGVLARAGWLRALPAWLSPLRPRLGQVGSGLGRPSSGLQRQRRTGYSMLQKRSGARTPCAARELSAAAIRAAPASPPSSWP